MIVLILIAWQVAQAAGDPSWSEPAIVRHGVVPVVRFQARLENEYLVIRASHESGWHTYAMDNELRAAEALKGKQSLGIEQGIDIHVSEGVKLAGAWLQSKPKDLSQPEIRWFTYGFEQTVFFACRVKEITADQAQVRIRGQACSGETCNQVDVTLKLSTADHRLSRASGTAAAKSTRIKDLVPVKQPSP